MFLPWLDWGWVWERPQKSHSHHITSHHEYTHQHDINVLVVSFPVKLIVSPFHAMLFGRKSLCAYKVKNFSSPSHCLPSFPRFPESCPPMLDCQLGIVPDRRQRGSAGTPCCSSVLSFGLSKLAQKEQPYPGGKLPVSVPLPLKWKQYLRAPRKVPISAVWSTIP